MDGYQQLETAILRALNEKGIEGVQLDWMVVVRFLDPDGRMQQKRFKSWGTDIDAIAALAADAAEPWVPGGPPYEPELGD
jgi:hypothetical protein